MIRKRCASVIYEVSKAIDPIQWIFCSFSCHRQAGLYVHPTARPCLPLLDTIAKQHLLLVVWSTMTTKRTNMEMTNADLRIILRMLMRFLLLLLLPNFLRNLRSLVCRMRRRPRLGNDAAANCYLC